MFTVRPLMQAPQEAKASNKPKQFADYSEFYWESTRETLIGIYSRRDPNSGLPIEDLNEIIHRVAYANAMAELKYALSPQELINCSLEDALSHPQVLRWAKEFADNIGKQRLWANSPGNINADPEISLKVLKYWAHGQLAGLKEDEIWLRSKEFVELWLSGEQS